MCIVVAYHVFQANKYGLRRSMLQLPGTMDGVMWPLLPYHYKQCYLSYNISYEIVLIFYCDRHISIHIIYFPLMYAYRIVLFLAIYVAMLTYSLVTLFSLLQHQQYQSIGYKCFLRIYPYLRGTLWGQALKHEMMSLAVKV